MLKEVIHEIYVLQKQYLKKKGKEIKREIIENLKTDIPFIQIISGIRRCGKSTLLRQLLELKIPDGKFLNFDDPRLGSFKTDDFYKFEEILNEEGKADVLCFDEIQNVKGWEKYIREAYNRGKKIYLTGSNAAMLSTEIGTFLTGRNIVNELFPFSYNEYLSFTNESPDQESFRNYLYHGGFPEYLKHKNEIILQNLYTDIVHRDIMIRYGIREQLPLIEFGRFLLTNIGKEFSANSLRKIFSMGATNTATSYLSYFQNCYLLFSIPRFSWSVRGIIRSPKKSYCIDTGLSRSLSLSFSKDSGRALENIVFLFLRRKTQDIFYFRKNKECDFLLREKQNITQAFQVCYHLHSDNYDREVNGLTEALSEFGLKTGTILTFNQEDQIKEKEYDIKIVPAWKWMYEAEQKK